MMTSTMAGHRMRGMLVEGRARKKGGGGEARTAFWETSVSGRNKRHGSRALCDGNAEGGGAGTAQGLEAFLALPHAVRCAEHSPVLDIRCLPPFPTTERHSGVQSGGSDQVPIVRFQRQTTTTTTRRPLKPTHLPDRTSGLTLLPDPPPHPGHLRFCLLPLPFPASHLPPVLPQLANTRPLDPHLVAVLALADKEVLDDLHERSRRPCVRGFLDDQDLFSFAAADRASIRSLARRLLMRGGR